MAEGLGWREERSGEKYEEGGWGCLGEFDVPIGPSLEEGPAKGTFMGGRMERNFAKRQSAEF